MLAHQGVDDRPPSTTRRFTVTTVAGPPVPRSGSRTTPHGRQQRHHHDAHHRHEPAAAPVHLGPDAFVAPRARRPVARCRRDVARGLRYRPRCRARRAAPAGRSTSRMVSTPGVEPRLEQHRRGGLVDPRPLGPARGVRPRQRPRSRSPSSGARRRSPPRSPGAPSSSASSSASACAARAAGPRRPSRLRGSPTTTCCGPDLLDHGHQGGPVGLAVSAALDRAPRRGQGPGAVGHRHADAALAEVDAHHPHCAQATRTASRSAAPRLGQQVVDLRRGPTRRPRPARATRRRPRRPAGPAPWP